MWGFVILVLVIKLFTSSYTSTEKASTDLWSHVSFVGSNSNQSKAKMELVLDAKKGIIIRYVKECPYETMVSKSISRGYTTSSSCANGLCNLEVSFNHALPKEVQLNIENQKTKECTLMTYQVAHRVRTIAYEVKLPINDELKSLLGARKYTSKNINFKHADGFIRSQVQGHEEIVFHFKEARKSDMLMVDKQEKFIVNFYSR